MRSGRPPLLVPLAFVVIGVILLLRNFQLIEGPDLLQYWPVLIVLGGIELLLRSDLGITWQMQTFGITRGAVQVASLEACSGELDVKVRALRREGRLIAGQYTARSRPSLDVRGDHARLVMQRGLTWPFSLADWEIGLAKDLPWNLLISTHLGELDIDLRGLQVNRAELSSGIGDVRVVLSEAVTGGVRARSTLGHVTLSVPREVEAVVRVISKPLARFQIDESRFLMLEPGLYATLGYEQSKSLIYAEVTSTFGTVRLA
jgi:hypothetical protein